MHEKRMDTPVFFMNISPAELFSFGGTEKSGVFLWLSRKNIRNSAEWRALFRIGCDFGRTGNSMHKKTRFSLIVPGSSAEKNGNIYHIFPPNQN
jgi:hypothetical protein